MRKLHSRPNRLMCDEVESNAILQIKHIPAYKKFVKKFFSLNHTKRLHLPTNTRICGLFRSYDKILMLA